MPAILYIAVFSLSPSVPPSHGIVMKWMLLYLSLFLIPATAPATDLPTTITSPDSRIAFRLHLESTVRDSGSLFYSVTRDGQTFIPRGQLGIRTRDIPEWTSGFSLRSFIQRTVDTVWRPVYGERSVVHDHHTAATFMFMRDGDTNAVMAIDVRVYNEGVAFRYRFPENLATSVLNIADELTSFTMPEGTMAWVTPFAQERYTRAPLRDWSHTTLPLPRWNPPTTEYESERPLTLELPGGGFAAIGEAGLVDYARMKLGLATETPNTIRARLFGPVTVSSPYATPWRLIMIADNPRELLEHNDIFLNLNEPCAIADTRWIRPGKIMREVTLSSAGAEACIDFCSAHNIAYIEFDAGWYGYEYTRTSDASRVDVDPRRNPAKDLDLPRVLAYAKQKNVGVFLYVNHRALEDQLDEILPVYERWGIAGLKFGFIHVGSDRWTAWMHEAVRKAARHHLMVDIHDEYRPTGYSRTYPNLLTQEGVYGNECMPEANLNATLPFTRFLAGAADYTICYYHQAGIKNVAGIKTTSAHQLALSVIYYSPLQFVFWYDKPSDYQGEPEVAFFDHLPTVWDTTAVILGEIERYAAVARRKDSIWFVGAITNNDGRTIQMPFSFLPRGTRWEATMYTDGGDAVTTRTHVRIDTLHVDGSTVLPVVLRPSGGVAFEIRQISEKPKHR
jgi:alpha-glucosidase